MIELVDDTATIIVTKLLEYKPPKKTVTVLSQDTSQKKEHLKRDRAEHKIPQPGNCMMPPQPEAYIKYPRYDFL